MHTKILLLLEYSPSFFGVPPAHSTVQTWRGKQASPGEKGIPSWLLLTLPRIQLLPEEDYSPVILWSSLEDNLTCLSRKRCFASGAFSVRLCCIPTAATGVRRLCRTLWHPQILPANNVFPSRGGGTRTHTVRILSPTPHVSSCFWKYQKPLI